jgi:hypothetical protein
VPPQVASWKGNAHDGKQATALSPTDPGLFRRVGSARSLSLLKRDDATRQTEEWYLHTFQAKAVKVCDVPQEKLEIMDKKDKMRCDSS